MVLSDSPYFKQVELIMKMMPVINRYSPLALKGGTTINLYVRELPRLSVDIDLVYLPLQDRQSSLKHIAVLLNAIADAIEDVIAELKVRRSLRDGKLHVMQESTRIKIEVSIILRGHLLEPLNMDVCEQVGEQFGESAMLVLHPVELYGGKLCATLDRQHPRDLFDVKILMDNEGITEELINVFLVYLICSSRPMAELLQPNRVDLKDTFENQFRGMEMITITVEELDQVREQLITEIITRLSDVHKQFLLDFKKGELDWSGFIFPNAADLPGVQWKQQNL